VQVQPERDQHAVMHLVTIQVADKPPSCSAAGEAVAMLQYDNHYAHEQLQAYVLQQALVTPILQLVQTMGACKYNKQCHNNECMP
jgi:hypothetical protein